MSLSQSQANITSFSSCQGLLARSSHCLLPLIRGQRVQLLMLCPGYASTVFHTADTCISSCLKLNLLKPHFQNPAMLKPLMNENWRIIFRFVFLRVYLGFGFVLTPQTTIALFWWGLLKRAYWFLFATLQCMHGVCWCWLTRFRRNICPESKGWELQHTLLEEENYMLSDHKYTPNLPLNLCIWSSLKPGAGMQHLFCLVCLAFGTVICWCA